MQLYPAIDLKDGKCVRLMQGDYEKVIMFSHEPEEIAKRWERLGASAIHFVDLDGAREGHSINEVAIKKVIEAVSIPVQVGGGIRTLEQIEAKLKLGASRIILGSSAVKDQKLLEEALLKFGSKRIIVGIDAKEG